MVVPFGPDDFFVFHVGTDSRIYYTEVRSDGSWLGDWIPVPGQTTRSPVAVAQFNNEGDLFMVYQGSGTDNNIYGTWFDGNGWHTPTNIGNGQTLSAPSITYNAVTNELRVAARGINQGIYTSHQTVGASFWPPFIQMTQGQQILTTPYIAATSDGNMVMSIVDLADQTFYRRFDRNLTPYDANWSQDRTGFLTFNSVFLSVIGTVVYALFVGFDSTAYWKQVTNL
jgi:hypothetical protein